MHRSEQLRLFFPGHVDKTNQFDEINRKRSQMSSNSQSQDFTKSQSTSFYSSTSNSLTDSQISSCHRYEDMLSSGRHMELKDSFEKMRKSINSLTDQVTSQKASLTSNNTQLNYVYKLINEIKTKQEDHDKVLSDITGSISELKRCLQDLQNIPTRRFVTEEDSLQEDMDTSSQDGMSLNAYLSSKSKKMRREVTEERLLGRELQDLSPTSVIADNTRKRSWSNMSAVTQPPDQMGSANTTHLPTPQLTRVSAPAHFSIRQDCSSRAWNEDQSVDITTDDSSGLLFDEL